MRQTARRPRILLADDHVLVLGGLRSMLESKFDVVGVVEDGRALVRAAEELKPDVILLDISMPKLNGIEAAGQISKSLPKSKLIFVTMHADATFVAEALRAGASGYVVKRSAPRELVKAIERVLRGQKYVTPLVAGGPGLSPVAESASAEPPGQLTPRQREVLQLVAEGRSVKEIADALYITRKTVEFHKTRIVQALGLNTTAQLVKYAIRHGIVSVDEI